MLKKAVPGIFRLAGIFLFAVTGWTQNLDYNSKVSVVLNDGTDVTLYAQLVGTGSAARPSKNYYYLPARVQLARDAKTKVPEFLFLKYVTDQRAEQGGVNGALMHFLMQVAFSPEQITEMETKLRSKVTGAVVKAPVDLFSASEGDTFTITSAVVNTASGMTKSVVTSGKAPLQQGGKIAVAANLDKNGAQLMAATFEKATSITDLSVNLFYKYFLVVNGLKAKFTVDYQKMAEVMKQDRIDGKYTWERVWFGQDKQTQTWTEVHKVYERMIEKKAITIEITEGPANETTGKITEALFQLFLTLVATPATNQPQAPPPADAEKEYLPGKKNAYNYHLKIVREEKLDIKKKDVVILNYNYAMPMELSVTQNLKSFYDAAKDNKNCIASVILGPGFYQHMDIRFVLDLDAREIFDQEINYVTVNVRKKRNSGNDFTDRLTFDKQYIADKGITRSLTYAAGDDRNADMYEYMSQWSLRGGNIYPANPQWQKGQAEAVTLSPPIVRRTIDFEADIDKLKAIGVSRVTLQVRYQKFGQEMEENIHVSPAASQNLVSKMLFMDRGMRGYVYRLVFNHITEGKLVLPWSAKLSSENTNDDYIYAMIPDQLSDKTSEVFIKAAEAAKTTSAPGPDGKVTNDKVLDMFKDVLAVPKSN